MRAYAPKKQVTRMYSSLVVTERGDSVTFEVRVVPRAKRSAIVGVHNGALKIALTAPPVEGAANEALREFIADWLHVAKRCVHIQRGDHSRTKAILVETVEVQGLMNALKLSLKAL